MKDRDHDRRALQDAAEAAARGDRSAFQMLHARLNPWILGLFRQRAEQWGVLGPAASDLSDDLSQRTWAALWASLSQGRYDPARAAITTFAYSVAHHIWLQHGKAQRRRPPGLSLNGPGPNEPDWLPAAGGDVGEERELAESIDAVRRALRGGAGEGTTAAPTLSAEESSILTGVGRGESDRALALRLGVSPSTAHARKRAALEKLRRLLGDERQPPADARMFPTDSAERGERRGE